jgi:hypothetical protein
MTTYEEVCLLAKIEQIWGFTPLLTYKEGIATMESRRDEIYPQECQKAKDYTE